LVVITVWNQDTRRLAQKCPSVRATPPQFE
jgi:hypothetical protein